jgi:hypothetical protein
VLRPFPLATSRIFRPLFSSTRARLPAWKELKIKGVIELPLRLGTVERLRTFVVVDRLPEHAIIGTHALIAFRAVIDLEENVLTLRDSNEKIRLGSPRVEEMYVSRMASTVRIQPGGQALVVSDVMGKAPEGCSVLIEGLPELDPLVIVAGASVRCRRARQL